MTYGDTILANPYRNSDAGVYCHWGDNYAYEVARALALDPQEGVLRLGIGHYNTVQEIEEALGLIESVLAVRSE